MDILQRLFPDNHAQMVEKLFAIRRRNGSITQIEVRIVIDSEHKHEIPLTDLQPDIISRITDFVNLAPLGPLGAPPLPNFGNPFIDRHFRVGEGGLIGPGNFAPRPRDPNDPNPPIIRDETINPFDETWD
jgi:hypothetical protein